MGKISLKKMLSVLFIVAISLVACTTLIGCGNKGNDNNNGGEVGGNNESGGTVDDNNGNTEETITKKVYIKGVAIYDDFSKVSKEDLTIKYNGEVVGGLSMDGVMTGNTFHNVPEDVTYNMFINNITLVVDSYYNYYIDTTNTTDFISEDGKIIAEFDIMLREASEGDIASDLVSLTETTIGVVNGGETNLYGVKIFAIADNNSENLITTSNANGFQIKFITAGTRLKFVAPDGYVFAGIKFGNDNIVDATEFPNGIFTLTSDYNNTPIRVLMEAVA